jgi:hypothetical protein
MSRKRPRRQQNLLSGSAFGLAIVLAIGGALHIVKQKPSDAERGGVAGYILHPDPNNAMAAAPAPAAASVASASARVAARPAAVGRVLGDEPVRPAVVAPSSVQPGQPEPIDSTADSPLIATTAIGIEPAAPVETVTTAPGAVEPLALGPGEETSELLAPAEFIAPPEEGVLDSLAPAAGAQPVASRMDVGDILGLLRAQGFGSFSAVSQRGNTFVFQALQGDRSVQVTVDAATGAVIGVQ